MGSSPLPHELLSADAARVLLVDDEPLNLEILAEHLDHARFCIAQAENGLIAWNMLDADPGGFDLVLLDRMMPVMGGMDLLARIKGDARFGALPIVMQTAAAARDQVAEGLRQGAHYYLTKPFEREILLAIVDSALEQRRARLALNDERFDAGLLRAAEFGFRTLRQARRLAAFLARLCPNPDQAVLGLSELMVNAIEHGNLAITYREKSVLNESGGWQVEVMRRLTMPAYAGRVASVRFERAVDTLRFTIADEGAGFDWRAYLEMSPDRAFDTHGRGIAMSRLVSFPDLRYEGRGNIVTVTLPLPAPVT